MNIVRVAANIAAITNGWVSLDKNDVTSAPINAEDNHARAIVKNLVESSLNDDLPICYDKESFQSKIDLLMNHFVDMAVQGYGWISTVAWELIIDNGGAFATT